MSEPPGKPESGVMLLQFLRFCNSASFLHPWFLHSAQITGMKVDFCVCKVDWVMGCPGIWPNIILGVSLRVFLGEVNTQICPPYMVGLAQSVKGQNSTKG